MVLRLSTVSCNRDLQKEREQATFDTEKLTYIIDGGEYFTKRRREVEELALKEKLFTDGPDYNFMSRSEKYDYGVKKAVHLIKRSKELGLTSPADYYWFVAMAFPFENAPHNLHTSMFLPTLTGQMTEEQKKKWLDAAVNYEIIGTYAQTEMGHGTHLRGVESTATYDSSTQEFILNSPTLTSAKWWPGGLGKTSNYIVFMANMMIHGKSYGLHPFIVQIRDMNTHEPLKGVTVGDIGPKFGYDMIDNGFLMLDHVRVPRENLLMKNAQVLPDGRYIKAKHDKLSYGTMVFVRSMLVNDAAQGLSAAATIAIRYSCVRRQSELEPGKPEPQILDYQTQQYKLFPLLATSYAFVFAGRVMRNIYFESNYEIQQGNTELLPELHALSAGLKAYTTDVTMWGIEQCRLACGGHGYSLASGISKIYATNTPACTYEGENTVMYLQTARYLLKAHALAKSKQPLANSMAYLSIPQSASRLDKNLNLDELSLAYKHRAKRLVMSVGEQCQLDLNKGLKDWQAKNQNAIDLVRASKAHCHSWIVANFVDSIKKQEGDAPIQAVLITLCKLYGAYGILENSGDFLEDGYLSSEQVATVRVATLDLLAKVRRDAVALVDAFDYSDHLLKSVLGRYDGNVYPNLFKWAQNSTLNQKQVHDSFHKYLKPLQNELKSKL